ncbi:outer membrane beta-barrel protein [Prevotella sp. 10(H)]|uniref:outer membrane beta-barrel protein n=1 Tax=Prevotella sp. 10(H) TaxID=1158294 RepID=UPI00068BAD0D|nr:outer membrane beta-barrel protein [Prevotella sp. 10(H)]
MKILYIILTLLILTGNLYAQRNYKSGYIITNDNDSIMGLIDFRTDKASGESCRFKISDSAEEQMFYPEDILKYRFINEGKYYVSQKIEIEGKTKTVFLEYLLQGMMNLYYYRNSDNNRQYYFFMDENGKMMQITKHPNEIVNSKIKEDNRYINILRYMFGTYPGMAEKVEKTPFDRGSLVELTKQYHDLTCTSGESCIVFENDYKRNFIPLKFSVYAGVQVASYSFLPEDRPYKSMKSVSPVIGGLMSISNPRWSRWISFQADLSFSALKGAEDHLREQTYYDRYSFDAMMGTFKVNAKYIIPINSRFRPAIQGGGGFMFLFASSSKLYTEHRYLGYLDVSEHKDSFLPSDFYYGYNLAIGLDYMTKNNKSFFGQIVYEKYQDKDRAKVDIFQLRLGYTF